MNWNPVGTPRQTTQALPEVKPNTPAAKTTWTPTGVPKKSSIYVPRVAPAPIADEPEQASWGDTFAAIPQQIKSLMVQTIAGIRSDTARELATVTSETRWERLKRERAEARGEKVAPPVLSEKAKEMRAVGQPIVDEQTAIARAAQEDAAAVTPKNQSLPQRAVAGAASSLTVSLPALLVGIVTRNPTVAAASMYPITKGQKLSEGMVRAEDRAADTLKKTGDKDAARAVYEKLLSAADAHATLQGFIEAGTELIPAKVLFKNGTPLGKRFVNFLAAELPGESIATVTQTLDDYIADLPDDVTAKDFVDGLVKGIKALPETWATVGLTAGPHVTVGHLSSRRARPAPDAGTTTQQSPMDSELPAVESAAPASAEKSPPPAPNPNYEYYQEQKAGGRSFGAQLEVRPLTEKDFQEIVKPYIAKGYANTLEEYQAKHPALSHILLERRDDGSYRLLKSGDVDKVRPLGETIRKVDHFDHPSAKEWGAIDAAQSQRKTANQVDLEDDSLLTAISKMGGLSREEAEAQGIDPAHFDHRGHKINLTFRKSGKTFDEMAELLAEYGYPVTNAEGNYDPNVLLDQLSNELAGKKVFSGRSSQYSAVEKLEQDAADEDARIRRAESFRPMTEDDLIALYRAYPESIDTDDEVGTLYESAEYPDDFDEHARKLSDLAEIAGKVDERATFNALERSGSDAEAAGKLISIIQRSEAQASQGNVDGIAIRNQPASAANNSEGKVALDTVDPVSEIQKHVNGIVNRWQHSRFKVSVVKNECELPSVPQGQPHESLIQATTVYPSKQIYIVGDRMKSAADVERTLFHELEGHVSIREFFGDEIVPFLKSVAKSDPAGVLRIGKRYRFYDAEGNPTSRVGMDSIAAEVFAADEYIAELAETINTSNSKTLRAIWDDLVARFSGLMRKVGWRSFTPTESEIRALLRRAQWNLSVGTKRNADDALASLAELVVENPRAADVSLKIEGSRAADARGNFLMNWLRKGYPIDRVFRMAFSPIGYIDEQGIFRTHALARNAAKKASDVGRAFIQRSSFQWMHHLAGVASARLDQHGVSASVKTAIESAKRGLIDRYGLSEEYKRRDLRREADRRSFELEAMDVFERLMSQGVDRKEAEVLYAALSGQPVDDARISELSAPIRAAIDQMGAEAVQLGLLAPEVYERNRGAYVHRTYLKHEQEGGKLAGHINQMLASHRKRIIGNQFKGRGIFERVTSEKLLRSVPDDWWGQSRVKGKLDSSITNQKFVVLDRIEQVGAGTETIPGVEPEPVKERVRERIYWPADKAIPNKMAGWTNRGTFEVRDVRGNTATLWRDYTKEERTRMGEVLDARYAITKTYMTMANDLASGRFFRDIALNPEWASATDPTGHSPDAKELMYGLYVDNEWVRMPETKVAGSGAPKWGALSGMYVRSEIWRDLNELDRMQRGGFWQSVLKHWKFNKTARNPVVHLNNIMSNLVLMDLGDVRARDLVRGIRSYFDKDENYRDAVRHGAFGGDFVSQEIRDKVLKPILNQLTKSELPGNTDKYSTYELGMRIVSGIRKADALLVNAYRIEDEVFRMAMYMRRLSLGDTPEAAAHAAREQFLNYDIRAPWVNAMRRTVLPFIAPLYRAVPLIAKNVYDRPWKVAKLVTLGYLLNALGYLLDDSEPDEDDERRLLREDEQGLTWLGVPRLIRLPLRDGIGQPLYLDIRRWIPAGDVFDMAQSQGALPMPAALQFGGPLAMGFELAFNRVAFTGKEITNPETDTAGERFKNIGDYLWKSYAPSAPWIPRSHYWDQISRSLKEGATDSFGRDYSTTQSFLSSVGVKLKPFDEKVAYAQRMFEIEKTNDALEFEARQLAQERARHLVSDAEFQRRLETIRIKQEAVAERVRRLIANEGS